MNEAMKHAWVEITRSFGEPTREELDVFLRTWQMAIEAEREACAKVCEEIYTGEEACGDWPTPEMCAAAIRARGQA